MNNLTDGINATLPRLNRRGRQTSAAPTIRFSLTFPESADKRLQVLAAHMGVTRHALASALVLHGLDTLEKELKEGNADAIRMVR